MSTLKPLTAPGDVLRILSVVVALVVTSPALVLSQGIDAVQRALSAHGGSALANVRTVTLRGQSIIGTTKQPLVISADLNGRIRFDYGQPVVRSLLLAPDGVMEVNGGTVSYPPPHVASFAQLDILGVIQVKTLDGLRSQYTTRGTGSVKNRATVKVNADSGRQQTHYRRTVADSIDVDFDTLTGHVLQISRRQYSDKSLDLSFICSWTFSNYQTVSGLVLPSVIEKSIDGRLLETITVESVELDAVFPTDLFERTGGRQ